MPDQLRSHRVESVRCALLDANDVPLRDLDGVTGCTLDRSVAATITGSGTLTLDDVGQGIDWLTHRVQPWWVLGDGTTWPLGVYLIGSPQEAHTPAGLTWTVELLDKVAVLDQDRVDGSFSLPAGTVVTDAVRAVIASSGQGSVAVTDSTATLTAGLVWEAGTTKLRITNDLLAAANYFALRCDGHGRFVVEPYTRPQDRTPAWDFAPGEAAMHEATFTRDQDLVSVPNKVVLVGAGTGTTPGLVGVATNTDPTSRFSRPRRGRWIVESESGVEATSQDVIDAAAARRLAAATSAAGTIVASSAVLPLDLNDTVTWATGGVTAIGVVTKTSLTLEVGARMSTTIREVG